MSLQSPLALTPLEVASGYVFGTVADAGLPDASGDSARSCLEAATLGALERQPCLVSFSGGRDSSAVLALAVHLARREGLPLPVPYTRRYPDAPETDEAVWQERVVAALGVAEWVRERYTHELDGVGPIATRVLLRHGLLWPANSHSLVPALEAAAGGSLLTGIGGDQVFDPSRLTRLAGVLALRERPEPRDVLRVALAVVPRPARRAILRRRAPSPVRCPWVRPDVLADLAAAYHREAAREPVRRDRWIRWTWSLRALRIGLAGLDALARDAGVQLVNPLLDERFLSAFASEDRRRPVQSRTEGMVRLFGDLLPADVGSRETKASFETPFWNEHSRRLAADVGPADLDCDLVDPAALRAFWAEPSMSRFRSLTLLQAVWLRRRSAGDGVPEAVDGVADGGPVGRPSQLHAAQPR